MEDADVIPCKIVILGDSGVGKTSICKRWVNGTFEGNLTPTIGSNFEKKTVNIANHKLAVSIWDTAGQEQYRSIAPLYTRSASSVIITTSVDDKNSFDDIQDWLSLVRESTADMPPTLLAINKSDLAPFETITEIIRQFKNLVSTVVLCSARTGEGIDNLFNTAAFTSYEFLTKACEKARPDSSISITDISKQQNSSGCC